MRDPAILRSCLQFYSYMADNFFFFVFLGWKISTAALSLAGGAVTSFLDLYPTRPSIREGISRDVSSYSCLSRFYIYFPSVRKSSPLTLRCFVTYMQPVLPSSSLFRFSVFQQHTSYWELIKWLYFISRDGLHTEFPAHMFKSTASSVDCARMHQIRHR